MTRTLSPSLLVVLAATTSVGCARPKPACSAAATCAECLELADCNWTGGQCADQCLMDTDCFGPGNPAAPSCPTAATPPAGANEEGVVVPVKPGITLVPGASLGSVRIGATMDEVSAAVDGAPVQVLSGEPATGEGQVQAGPYAVDFAAGRVIGARISLADASRIAVGDLVLEAGISGEQVAARLAGCAQQANRGATVWTCDGVTVSAGGPADATPSIGVIARP
jgi:hypothetical protein